MVITPANERDRAQVVVEEPVQAAFVDQWLINTKV
jgi:hypothetical protein